MLIISLFLSGGFRGLGSKPPHVLSLQRGHTRPQELHWLTDKLFPAAPVNTDVGRTLCSLEDGSVVTVTYLLRE